MTAATFDPSAELPDNKLARLRSEVGDRRRAVEGARLPSAGNDLWGLYRAACTALRRAELAAAVDSVPVF